jgi:SAM-dependent methyltransferase
METGAMLSSHHCRSCGASIQHSFVDLGMSPLCESYVSPEQSNAMEPFYPLHAYVCEQCWLVQLLEYVSASEIFSHYAYFSSYSSSWLRHAEDYVRMITRRLRLLREEQVIEIASNDGYLLQYFVQQGHKVLGIEPAANVAEAAVKKGVPSRVAFFGRKLASELVQEGLRAKLLLGNNVLAHVPDLNDFVGGLKILLAADGTITMEFPHLQRLIEGNQFDTIYHEHFCYFSFLAVATVFKSHGLRIYDVEELSTHGGSLRIYAGHQDWPGAVETERVRGLRERELNLGYDRIETYQCFRRQVEATKWSLLEFLIKVRRDGKHVAGYGAPGKGNTLLNYCGIRTDLLDYTVDRNPFKHGKFLPGTHIPIFSPEKIQETRPDYVLVLPWNLRDEIVKQLEFIREWGGKFIVPIPMLEVV